MEKAGEVQQEKGGEWVVEHFLQCFLCYPPFIFLPIHSPTSHSSTDLADPRARDSTLHSRKALSSPGDKPRIASDPKKPFGEQECHKVLFFQQGKYFILT